MTASEHARREESLRGILDALEGGPATATTLTNALNALLPEGDGERHYDIVTDILAGRDSFHAAYAERQGESPEAMAESLIEANTHGRSEEGRRGYMLSLFDSATRLCAGREYDLPYTPAWDAALLPEDELREAAARQCGNAAALLTGDLSGVLGEYLSERGDADFAALGYTSRDMSAIAAVAAYAQAAGEGRARFIEDAPETHGQIIAAVFQIYEAAQSSNADASQLAAEIEGIIVTALFLLAASAFAGIVTPPVVAALQAALGYSLSYFLAAIGVVLVETIAMIGIAFALGAAYCAVRGFIVEKAVPGIKRFFSEFAEASQRAATLTLKRDPERAQTTEDEDETEDEGTVFA